MTATNVTDRDKECPSCGASLDRARSADVEALVRNMQVQHLLFSFAQVTKLPPALQAAAEGVSGVATSHGPPTGQISVEMLISMLQRTMAGGGGLGGAGIGRDDAVRDEDMEGVLQRLMDQCVFRKTTIGCVHSVTACRCVAQIQRQSRCASSIQSRGGRVTHVDVEQ
jgi:hypothetical protein